MTKPLKFENDNDVHDIGRYEHCRACVVTDYPRPHAANTCPGQLHAEHRFDLEPDIAHAEVRVVECCDFCDHASSRLVDDVAQKEAALALREEEDQAVVVDAVRKEVRDEPSFTLKARDAFAVPCILIWQNLAICMGVRQSKLIESNALVRDMIAWQRKHKTKIPD